MGFLETILLYLGFMAEERSADEEERLRGLEEEDFDDIYNEEDDEMPIEEEYDDEDYDEMSERY